MCVSGICLFYFHLLLLFFIFSFLCSPFVAPIRSDSVFDLIQFWDKFNSVIQLVFLFLFFYTDKKNIADAHAKKMMKIYIFIYIFINIYYTIYKSSIYIELRVLFHTRDENLNLAFL